MYKEFGKQKRILENCLVNTVSDYPQKKNGIEGMFHEFAIWKWSSETTKLSKRGWLLFSCPF